MDAYFIMSIHFVFTKAVSHAATQKMLDHL